uniref:Polysaccharide pyruvyl transferase domain-containing protein n=1 Tax=Geobacter metallireducens TaxID=28232 RepID=A0A831UHV5_GEOME
MRILLVGYYGFNNAGDELMLAALVRELRERSGDAAITAFSNSPAATAARHGIGAIPFVHRGLLRTYLRHLAAVARHDLLLFGGGTFLQDYGTQRWYSLVLFVVLVLAARLSGRRVLILGAGAGPLETTMGRRLARLIVGLSHGTVLRDRDSLTLLREIGCRGEQLALGADLLFHRGGVAGSPARRPATGKRLGLSLFPFFRYVHGDDVRDAAFTAEVVRLLERLEGEGYAITFFCLQEELAGGDNRYAVELNRRFGGRLPVVTFAAGEEAFRDALAAMDLAVGMRYHFLVLALLAGVPVAGIAYNPKVASIMVELGRGDCCLDIHRFDADTMFALVELAAARGVDMQRLDEMRERAAVNYALLERFLETGGRS